MYKCLPLDSFLSAWEVTNISYCFLLGKIFWTPSYASCAFIKSYSCLSRSSMHAITAVFSVPFRKEELTRTRKWGRRGCIDRLIGSFNSEGNVTFEQWGQWFTWLQNNSRAVSEERSTIADSNEMKVNDPRRQFMALYLSSSEYGQQSKGLIFFWPYSICSSKTYSCFTSYLHSWSCCLLPVLIDQSTCDKDASVLLILIFYYFLHKCMNTRSLIHEKNTR